MTHSSPEIWYCRKAEVEIGPIGWSQLCQMVGKGEFTAEHEVRMSYDGHDGQWLPIARILHLLPGVATNRIIEAGGDLEKEAQETARQAMGSHQSDLNKQAFEPKKSIVWQSPPSLSSFLEPVSNTAIGFASCVVGVAHLIGRLLLKLVVPAAVLLLVAMLNWAIWIWLNTDSETTQIEKVKYIGAKYQELRARKVNDSEWRGFVSESLKTLEPMVPLFEKHASSKRPIQQHLMWASRDCLIPMLNAPQGESPQLERKFREHMFQIRYKILRIDDTRKTQKK